MNRGVHAAVLAFCCLLTAACGASATDETLSVSPQDTSFVVGTDRIGIALLDQQQNPVHATNVQVRIVDVNGQTVATTALHNIGPEYGGIPVYTGVARFPDVGQYEFLVSATAAGQAVTGHAYVTVVVKGAAVAIGARAPLVNQPILGDPGVSLATIDSGLPPDDWHSTTIAQGVAQRRPMVLFFGDPAFCPSKTCGPTHEILAQLCAQFCGQLLFEHIETYYPAGPPGPTADVNPGFTAFGLQTDPWVYFVNADGVVADRYEGPVTLSELTQSAQGTLAGKVPAVPLG